MKATHRLTVEAVCPADGSADRYEVTIETGRTIPVEEILATVRLLTVAPVYQEQLTRGLADELHARVVTVGVHSGVHTTCEAAS